MYLHIILVGVLPFVYCLGSSSGLSSPVKTPIYLANTSQTQSSSTIISSTTSISAHSWSSLVSSGLSSLSSISNDPTATSTDLVIGTITTTFSTTSTTSIVVTSVDSSSTTSSTTCATVVARNDDDDDDDAALLAANSPPTDPNTPIIPDPCPPTPPKKRHRNAAEKFILLFSALSSSDLTSSTTTSTSTTTSCSATPSSTNPCPELQLVGNDPDPLDEDKPITEKRGPSDSPEYIAWDQMGDRCSRIENVYKNVAIRKEYILQQSSVFRYECVQEAVAWLKRHADKIPGLPEWLEEHKDDWHSPCGPRI
ncbi:hypothetical protein BCON_0131g00100 [Botryotinia convoluta]|uniref:Ig-like domain-containing protein n=1 Tax=Botryotinia convoluta TaxID=54673 RepID=A0A4Z1I0N3_9HELO|nr:hypothetical protein BCON_0131g00100 [Botryotinia convoluta]